MGWGVGMGMGWSISPIGEVASVLIWGIASNENWGEITSQNWG